MAQTIKLKRSGTSGAIPTTSQLELGEVAINTYDGKMYIKKNVGGTESIVEVTVAAADAIVVEYQFTATANQTTFSGSDDNSETLSYSAGAVQIFLNGILLDSGVDYTATNGTSIVLSEVVDANDYLQVFAFKKKISNGQTTVDTFTGDNSTTAFTLSLDPGDENNTRVYIDGVYQSKGNYSVSGTTLTFSTAPPTSTAIEVEIGNRVVTLDTLSDLDLPDNVKLRLGTSQDADFYHDGTDTYLRNQTGQLLIRGNDTKLQSYLGETYATFANNGAATLYYDNSAKLATTSTGVDITGTVTTDGLTVNDGTNGVVQFGPSNTRKIAAGADYGGFRFYSDSSHILYTNNTQRLQINSGGDISFYEDTGSTAKLTWDSSAETFNFADNGKAVFGAGSDLQIYHDGSNSYISDQGTGNLVLQGSNLTLEATDGTNYIAADDGVSVFIYHPDATNQVKLSTTSTGITVTGRTTTDNATVGSGTASTYVDLTVNGASTANYGPMIELQSAGTAFGKISNYGRIQGGTSTDMFVTTATTNNLLLGTNNAERMRIDSSGNVGIGTSSNLFDVLTVDDTNPKISMRDSGIERAFFEVDSSDNFVINNKSISAMILETSDTERMRIDSSGNVGIGTTSPVSKLHVQDGNLTISSPSGSGGRYLILDNTATGGRDYRLISTNDSHGSLGGGDFAILDYDISGNDAAKTRLLINSSGNIGIGTTAPKFHLQTVNGGVDSRGTGSGVAIRNNLYYSGGDKYLTGSGAASTIWMDGSGNFRFYNTGTSSTGADNAITNLQEVFHIGNSGNVGVGTTSPERALHVVGGIHLPNNNIISWDQADGTLRNAIYVDSGDDMIIGDTNFDDIYFSTGQKTKTVVIKQTTGNVGIGTTSPTMPLSVQAASNAYAISMHGRSDGYSELYGASNDGSTKYSFLQSHSAQTKLYTLVNTPLLFGTNSTQRMVIRSDGELRLGTGSTERPFAKITNWGYSTAYRVLMLGSASTTYGTAGSGSTTISMGYDPSGNADSSFTGNGREILFRRGAAFVTPNAADDDFYMENLVLQDGKVGIGTASPGERLEVDGIIEIKRTSDHPAMRFSEVVSGSATTRAYMGSGDWAINGGDADDFGISGSGTGDLLLGTNAGAERMRIQNSTGNVGIGTTSPNAKLETRNSTTATDTIIASAGLATAGNYHELILGDSRNYAVGLRRYITQSNPSYLRPRLDFIVQGQDTYLPADREVRMSIKDNGNVGIGTTSPATKFHVSAGSTNANIIARLEQGTTAGNYSAVEVGRTDGSGNVQITPAVTGGVPISGIPGILFGSTNGALPAVGIQTPNSSSGHIVFSPKGTEKVRITADGNVGIGASSPNSTLTVAGNIEITGTNRLLLPNFWIGPVPNTANNNNGAVLLVNLTTLNSNNIGFQFSGSIIGNSYTGQAFVTVSIVKHYLNDNVAFDVGDDQNLNSTVSRLQLQLCTVTYNSNSYLAIVKNGGGTGTIFLNGYFQGWYPSQVTEVASGAYTVTTTHGNLNY